MLWISHMTLQAWKMTSSRGTRIFLASHHSTLVVQQLPALPYSHPHGHNNELVICPHGGLRQISSLIGLTCSTKTSFMERTQPSNEAQCGRRPPCFSRKSATDSLYTHTESVNTSILVAANLPQSNVSAGLCL